MMGSTIDIKGGRFASMAWGQKEQSKVQNYQLYAEGGHGI